MKKVLLSLFILFFIGVSIFGSVFCGKYVNLKKEYDNSDNIQIIETLSKEIENLNKENAKLLSQLEKLTKESEVLTSNYKVQVEELNNTIKDLSQQVKQYEEQLEQIENSNESYKAGLSNLQSQVSSLNDTIGSLERKIQGLEEQIDYYKNSYENNKQYVEIDLSSITDTTAKGLIGGTRGNRPASPREIIESYIIGNTFTIISKSVDKAKHDNLGFLCLKIPSGVEINTEFLNNSDNIYDNLIFVNHALKMSYLSSFPGKAQEFYNSNKDSRYIINGKDYVLDDIYLCVENHSTGLSDIIPYITYSILAIDSDGHVNSVLNQYLDISSYNVSSSIGLGQEGNEEIDGKYYREFILDFYKKEM